MTEIVLPRLQCSLWFLDECNCQLCCQDSMDESESVLLQLHCAHWFHDDCIRRWAESTNTRPGSRCPLRCVIPEEMMDQHEALDQDGDHGFEILENHEPNTNFA